MNISNFQEQKFRNKRNEFSTLYIIQRTIFFFFNSLYIPKKYFTFPSKRLKNAERELGMQFTEKI